MAARKYPIKQSKENSILSFNEAASTTFNYVLLMEYVISEYIFGKKNTHTHGLVFPIAKLLEEADYFICKQNMKYKKSNTKIKVKGRKT